MKSKGQRATKKGATALGNRLAVPQKVKLALPCGSAIPLPVFFPKEMERYLHKKAHTGVFTEALFVGMETLGHISCS